MDDATVTAALDELQLRTGSSSVQVVYEEISRLRVELEELQLRTGPIAVRENILRDALQKVADGGNGGYHSWFACTTLAELYPVAKA